jgi:hypothetical protein
LYFSWTYFNETQGNHFCKAQAKALFIYNLVRLDSLQNESKIYSLEVKEITIEPYF